MADPITATLIASAVLGGAGSLFSGFTAYQSGKAQKKAANQAAARAEQEGNNKARVIRGQSRRLAGAQRARFAAAGIDLSGSAVDVQYDSAIQYETDALNQIYLGNQQVADLRTQGNFAYKDGLNKFISSGFSAGGSILGGMGQASAAGTASVQPSFTSVTQTGSGAYGGGYSTGARSTIGR
jgi:hypothetical protein